MLTKYAIWMQENEHKPIYQLWEEQTFFDIRELVSEKVYKLRGDRSIELFNPVALFTLLETRVLAESPFTINTWLNNGRFHHRGFRLSSFYSKVSFSQHLFGNAFDYDVSGMTAKDFIRSLITWKRQGKLKGLCGIEKGVNWNHNDYRTSGRTDDDGLFIFKP